jgi:metal-responsive CopG/Arc/MetJ family transcriptional regulator
MNTVTVSITIAKSLAEMIDQAGREIGVSRSQYVSPELKENVLKDKEVEAGKMLVLDLT